ncbi:hypothetical protein N7478_006713 [Penicillium angulare]|uniref:uncharacterized protein n=1 Tax=Penicillium angulare TaxID=116970 RepID=UPI0025416C8D|nr:uncharacterized protein N7478_006713 [Penicillium angulare]KAJ5281341.1 hypothetical protein N7478_006713 [Penicillium angulare]
MALTRVAACHVSPHFLSARKTVDKATSFVQTAAKNSANLIVLPETYISAFPIWSALRPPTENHDLFRRMVQQSIYADGKEVQALRDIACDTNSVISIGISEKANSNHACLYNLNLIIGHTGEILVHHRKLMPTFFEKLIWSPGDGYGLRVADTPYGRIDGLICGENTNPLARFSLIAQREEKIIFLLGRLSGLHVFHRHLMMMEMQQRLRRSMIMFLRIVSVRQHTVSKQSSSTPDVIRNALLTSSKGVSMFLDSSGAPSPSFRIDEEIGEQRPTEFLQNEEGIIYADLELSRCIEGKQYHDVVGEYQRLDVFELKVNRSRKNHVNFTESRDVEE